jgi:anti-sigma factor RsiW
MHQAIQDGLEEYLRDPDDWNIPQEFRSHLAACSACAKEVESLVHQTRLLRALRNPLQTEPAPGFYARVLDRIEQEQPQDSVWVPFLDPAFGRRLAIACAALVVALGTYLVASEQVYHHSTPGVVVSHRSPSDADSTFQTRQRDAVLVSLASYRE